MLELKVKKITEFCLEKANLEDRRANHSIDRSHCKTKQNQRNEFKSIPQSLQTKPYPTHFLTWIYSFYTQFYLNRDLFLPASQVTNSFGI